jgi:phosphatidylserine synthase
MSNTDNPSSTPNPSATPPTGDWRSQRRAERAARRSAWGENRPHMGWGGLPIGGFIVLAIGIVLLLGNLGFSVPHNWWAVLLLVPAVAALVNAIRFYRYDGPQSPRVMGSAIGGLVMLALALALFFDIGLGLFWPVIVIIVGVAIVARSVWR